MYGFSVLNSLLSKVVIGALNLVIAGLLLYLWYQDGNWAIEGLVGLLPQLQPYLGVFAVFVTVMTLSIGLFVDSIGHWTDTALFRLARGTIVPEKERQLIFNSVPKIPELSFDRLLESYFYMHAPENILKLHDIQWTHYEFSRNLFITAIVHTIVGGILLVSRDMQSFAWVWIVIGGLIVASQLAATRWLIRYYYRIETVFVIGWLRHNGQLKTALVSSLPETEPTQIGIEVASVVTGSKPV